ncbi:MAG: RNA polymerase sigma factor [Acidiferrobacterales bacterium]
MDILKLFCRTRESRALLENSRAQLYRVAYSWCHNPALADDIVQETLIKAYKKSDQLRDPKAARSWLFSILSNCYNDHFRRNRETEDIDNVSIIDEKSPETETRQLQIVEKVRKAVATLSEGQRQVVTLVDLEGFSYIEVATILDIPIGTVMSRLCRARKTLKDILITEYGDSLVKDRALRRVK